MDDLISIHTKRIFYEKPKDYDFDSLHFGKELQDYINNGVVARYNLLQILERLKQVDAICIKQRAQKALNDIPEYVRQDLVTSYERHNAMFFERFIKPAIDKNKIENMDKKLETENLYEIGKMAGYAEEVRTVLEANQGENSFVLLEFIYGMARRGIGDIREWLVEIQKSKAKFLKSHGIDHDGMTMGELDFRYTEKVTQLKSDAYC